jgi:hypothetical protein
MFHTRITTLAWAGILVASGAMAQAPTAQRQMPTRANQVLAPGTTTSASPTSAGAAMSAANKPGGAASQPAAAGAPGALTGGGGKVDASAAGARIGGMGGATQAQGSKPGTAALPANQFQQAADGRAAAAPDAGKPVTPADLSREAQLRKLADPRGGLDTSAGSPAAGLVGGSSAADLVRDAGATPQAGAGKNEASRQAQQSSESWAARNPLEQKWRERNIAATGVDRQPSAQERADLASRNDRGLGLPAFKDGSPPPPSSDPPVTPGLVWDKVSRGVYQAITGEPPGKFDPKNTPHGSSGVRGKPNPEGTVRPEGNPVPTVDAGRAPISAADAARKTQVSQPVDDQRRTVERMTPTPEARRDMVQPSGTRTNPADGRGGDGTAPQPGAKTGSAPPPGGKAPEQIDQSRPGSKPGKKPDDPSGG